MVASNLSLDENALQAELNKMDLEMSVTTANFNPIVTKSSNLLEKAQKNLLSCYLVYENPFSLNELGELIGQIKFSNERLIIVKTTIDKLICSVNNVKALIEGLYTNFAQDEDLKAIITDLICISETFNKLSRKDFKSIIDENINKITRCFLDVEETEIKNLYKNVNDNDSEALKLQIQLRDKINSKLTGDY